MMRYQRYMHHYVYKVSFGKAFYLGVRSSKKTPDQDSKYIGSGCFILFTIKRYPAIKEILSVHETREDAEREESRLLTQFVGTLHCVNRKRTRCRKYSHV